MRDLRVCVVGAGGLSSKSIYLYIGVAGAHLAGVCDIDLEKAARNAYLFGGRPYRNTESNSFLLDFCIHIIDLIGYLFGNVEQVFSFSKEMDAYAVSLKFKNGIHSHD